MKLLIFHTIIQYQKLQIFKQIWIHNNNILMIILHKQKQHFINGEFKWKILIKIKVMLVILIVLQM